MKINFFATLFSSFALVVGFSSCEAEDNEPLKNCYTCTYQGAAESFCLSDFTSRENFEYHLQELRDLGAQCN